jgi:hypothetical protein
VVAVEVLELQALAVEAQEAELLVAVELLILVVAVVLVKQQVVQVAQAT